MYLTKYEEFERMRPRFRFVRGLRSKIWSQVLLLLSRGEVGSDFVYVRVGCKAIEAQGFGMQIWLQTHGFLGGGEEERRIEFCLGFILHACALLPPLPRL